MNASQKLLQGEKMKAKAISMTIAVLAFSGCVGSTHWAAAHARIDMMQAKTAYTQCLQENSAQPDKCAGLEQAYQIDLLSLA